MKLENGSRVAVIGGGPAGSFFACFLLDMARRTHKDIAADIFEFRDFGKSGAAGCNNCGGIISEWLVQALAADGLSVPTQVIERGIDSYVMHLDVGDSRIDPPLHEKRIAAVYRGSGPRGYTDGRIRSFDQFLLEQARQRGARVMHRRIDRMELRDGRPFLRVNEGEYAGYDLLAVAMGKNNVGLREFQKLGFGYVPPKVSRTYITEIQLGRETVSRSLGNSMHVFLPDMPRIKFAAIIPKGDYATLCILGEQIDRAMVTSLVNSPEVRHCLPPGWEMRTDLCHCAPYIAVGGAKQPFADRIVFVGDCGVTRLYKDGIGAAYRTAKAAAVTAVFEGVAAGDFEKHYAPIMRTIARDNDFGRVIYLVTKLMQRSQMIRRGVLRMLTAEQRQASDSRLMSGVVWDTFTGSAPYKDVFLRTLRPGFLLALLYHIGAGLFRFTGEREHAPSVPDAKALGKVFKDGEVIVREGEVGDTMYVIESGGACALRVRDGNEVVLNSFGPGDFFGEMALIEPRPRSATVRAVGETRTLTVDKRTFRWRISEDPSLAYRILQRMSQRVRTTSETAARTSPRSSPSNSPYDPSVGRDAVVRKYQAGEILMHEGESGDCMFEIRSGEVEVLKGSDQSPSRIAVCRAGDFIGEMALFEDDIRSATVRALGDVKVRSFDRSTFLRRVHFEPALAHRLMVKFSRRLANLDSSVAPFPTDTKN